MNDSTIECDHCGACCTKLIIEISHIDVVREPQLAVVAPPCRLMPGEDEWDRQYMLAVGTATNGCPMHKEDRCSIYPTRPNVCVAFQAGSPECQRARHAAGKPPLGLDAWPTDEEEFCKLIGEGDDAPVETREVDAPGDDARWAAIARAVRSEVAGIDLSDGTEPSVDVLIRVD